MGNMTLAVPTDLKSKMDGFPEINWSEVARQAFAQKLKDLELLKSFSSKSSMTEKDAISLGKSVRRNLAKRYSEKGA